MNRFYFLLLLVLVPINVLAFSGTSTFNVDIDVNNCNNNNVCEVDIDEDFLTCVNDCPVTCIINGVCQEEMGENTSNCDQDCAVSTSTVTTVVASSGGGGAYISTPYTVYNVINLLAQPGDAKVLLSWEILDSSNYGGVMIRRSDIFPPSSVTDGGILYDGKGELTADKAYSLIDSGLTNGHWYFYTVFLYDKLGKFSSGASVASLPQSESMKDGLKDLIILPKKLPPELSIPLKIISTSTNYQEPIINVTQNNKLIEFGVENKKNFVLEPNVTTTILINKEDVPVGTTAIMVTIDNNTGFDSLFLNKDENGNYNLTIPAKSLLNGDNLFFTFIDKNKQALNRAYGVIKAAELENSRLEKPSSATSKISSFLGAFGKILSSISDTFLDITMMMVDLAVLVLKLLKNWVYILGLLVIHK